MPDVQALFDTIPRKDNFGLFHGTSPNYEKIVDILDFKKQDIAKASSVPLASIRFDQKMPQELRDRMIEWAVAIWLVTDYFSDLDRTMLWFRVANPLLGGISPRDMIRIGRFPKLLKFIQTALNENRR
jgi:hypothetical protein